MNTTTKVEYVAIDTETTGLFKNDRIIEIACIVFNENEILEEWSTLVNPMRDVGPTHIHGITPSMVSMAPTFDQIANDLLRLINGRIIVAHNASFDLRMLNQEFTRLNQTINLGKPFCTMLASRELLNAGNDSLAEVCETLRLPIEYAHSALGDARMAQKIFSFVRDSEQPVSPSNGIYDASKLPTATFHRQNQIGISKDANSRIRNFSKKVPFPTTDQKEVAYLLLLNLAMEDLDITPSEKNELIHWAEALGVTEDRVAKLHRGYLDSFIQSALRDGVISDTERRTIEQMAIALELEVEIPESPLRLREQDVKVKPGSRICFTGAATSQSGTPILRSDLEAMASKFGLFPVPSVTKKGCDVLVAADESSMSGKAQKAREWGILVLSVDKFVTLCTFG